MARSGGIQRRTYVKSIIHHLLSHRGHKPKPQFTASEEGTWGGMFCHCSLVHWAQICSTTQWFFEKKKKSANLMDKGTSRNRHVEQITSGCVQKRMARGAGFSFVRELVPGFRHIQNFVHQKASPFMTNATKCCDSDSCQLVHRFTCWLLSYISPGWCFKLKTIKGGNCQVHHFLDLMYVLPSGKLTELWRIAMFNGKVHYFYGHFQ